LDLSYNPIAELFNNGTIDATSKKAIRILKARGCAVIMRHQRSNDLR